MNTFNFSVKVYIEMEKNPLPSRNDEQRMSSKEGHIYWPGSTDLCLSSLPDKISVRLRYIKWNLKALELFHMLFKICNSKTIYTMNQT